MSLPVLAGCESYTYLLYANPAVSDAKQVQACSHNLVGLGRIDLTGNEAMHLGGITIVRNIEYHVTKFHGLGGGSSLTVNNRHGQTLRKAEPPTSYGCLVGWGAPCQHGCIVFFMFLNDAG